MMTTLRLLLPCTSVGDTTAIHAAIQVAQSCGAILVPLSLRRSAQMQDVREGARLVPRKEADDFLGTVLHSAAIMDVPVEWVDLSPRDAVRSIDLIFQEKECAAVLLFVRGGAGVLLETTEVQQVIAQRRGAFTLLVHLLPQESVSSRPAWLSRWFQKWSVSRLVRRKRAAPLWYRGVQLVCGLIVAGGVFLNGFDVLTEPRFDIASLIAKSVFLFVLALSLFCIPHSLLEAWWKTHAGCDNHEKPSEPPRT
ncbi:MAG: hypothetical protein M3Z08_01625 [Chloroflexota bacterium]|nr:hypothetical protein [Chloroflexota bacterium]